MSEMLERGAKAMQEKRRELINQPLERIWPELMRAAIEAMREPTVDMCREAAWDDWGPDACQECWRAMIGIALKEKDPATP